MAEPQAAQGTDEIAKAQEDLGRALGRARIGEDRELSNQVRELGERVAHLLSGLLRMTRLHSAQNSAFDKPVEDLGHALEKLRELLGSIHLVAVEEQVYVNDIRIRTGEKTTSIQDLSGELRRHNVGGIVFRDALDGSAIRLLVGALGGQPAATDPRNALGRKLAEGGLSGIELQGRFRFRLAGEAAQDRKERVLPQDLVERALVAVDEEFQNLAAGRVPNPLPLRRVISEVLERGLDAEELWAEPGEVNDLAAHQLRVAVLALLLGEGLGLAPALQQDLGVAALYHDCGYAAGGPAHGGDVALEDHVWCGARLLLRQKGFHEAKVRRVLVALQHHREHGGARRPALFARMVRIAEDYDALSHRVGRLAPTFVLTALQKWAGTRYDPALLQAFVNVLGAYPPGTLLRVADGSVMRVVAPARTREAFTRPRVRCLRLADGSEPAAAQPTFDLQQAAGLTILSREARPAPG